MAAELTLTVTEVAGSADVAANTSRVRIDLSITTTLGTWSHDYTTEGYIQLDGAQIVDLDGKWVDINTTTHLYSGEHTVQHKADGTGTVTVDAGFNMNTTYTGWVYAEKTLTLAVIPRASTMTVPEFTMGTAGKLSVSKAADSFTHTIKYTFGTKSGTVCTKSSAKTVSWTPSVTLAEELPSDVSGTGTLTITTYNGSTKVGDTKSYAFTAHVPTSVKPNISAFTVSLVNSNSAIAGWGVAVKGKTKLSYAITAAGSNGSTVKSYQFSCAGKSGTAASGTTSLLSQTGTFTPKATVKDSRGRSAEASADSVTVYDYSEPSISSSGAFRCTSGGTASETDTYIAVRCKGTFASVNGKNSLTIRVRTRPTGGSWSGYTTLQNNVQKLLSGFEATRSYEVELSVTDAVGGSKTVRYIVPTENVTFLLKDGGTAASFGKYPENSGLDMGWDIHMNGNRVTGLPPHTADSDAVPWTDISAYGLGGSKKITWSEIDSAQAPGWYHIAEENTICGHTASYWYMHVAAYSSGTAHCTQTLYSIKGDYTFDRRQNTGTWSAWVNTSPSSYIKYDLLWENASRTSSFAAQTITVNASAYNALAVDVSYNQREVNGSEIRVVALRPKSDGAETIATLTAHLITSANAYNTVKRKITVNHNRTEIKIEGGLGNDGSANDNNAIPLKIYGIKGV